ncbi:hypothetical protein GGI12_000464 [Dipsacomyces acuminosporus]|nr:hypothetical protein GGI12_000464 [Dipsacomyces acuminosporus]
MHVKLGFLFAAASALMSAASVSAACAPNTPNLIVFGDSLSDNGNDAKLIPGITYWNGRFSNSYVWNEYTAKVFGTNLINHAYGGATTNNNFSPAVINNVTIPSYHDQVASWLKANPRPSQFNLDNDIIQVGIGGNDAEGHIPALLTGAESVAAFASKLAENIVSDTQLLVNAGYKNIYLWDLPPMDISPGARALGPAIGAQLKVLGETTNAAIRAAVTDLIRKNSAKTKGIRLFSLADLMRVAMTPEVLQSLGVTDTTTACFVRSPSGPPAICSNGDEHAFYDEKHPASRMHYIWGVSAALLTISPNSTISTQTMIWLSEQFDIKHSDHDHNIIANGISRARRGALASAARSN